MLLLFFLCPEVQRIVNGEMYRAGCNQLVDLPPLFAPAFLKQRLVDAVLPTVHSCPSLACLRPSSIKVRTIRNSHFSTMLRMVRVEMSYGAICHGAFMTAAIANANSHKNLLGPLSIILLLLLMSWSSSIDHFNELSEDVSPSYITSNNAATADTAINQSAPNNGYSTRQTLMLYSSDSFLSLIHI